MVRSKPVLGGGAPCRYSRSAAAIPAKAGIRTRQFNLDRVLAQNSHPDQERRDQYAL